MNCNNVRFQAIERHSNKEGYVHKGYIMPAAVWRWEAGTMEQGTLRCGDRFWQTSGGKLREWVVMGTRGRRMDGLGVDLWPLFPDWRYHGSWHCGHFFGGVYFSEMFLKGALTCHSGQHKACKEKGLWCPHPNSQYLRSSKRLIRVVHGAGPLKHMRCTCSALQSAYF